MLAFNPLWVVTLGAEKERDSLVVVDRVHDRGKASAIKNGPNHEHVGGIGSNRRSGGCG